MEKGGRLVGRAICLCGLGALLASTATFAETVLVPPAGIRARSDSNVFDRYSKQVQGSNCTPCPGGAGIGYDFPSSADKPPPPNTTGAVGPNHVMTMSDTEVRIQNRLGITLSTMTPPAFWGPISLGAFEQRLVYDSIHERWIATARVDGSSGFAISSTSDPTGAWTYYFLPSNVGDINDLASVGFNTSWIVVTAEVWSNSDFQGPKLWVIDKGTALAGGPLTITIFPPGFDGSTGTKQATMQACLTLDPLEQTLWIVNVLGSDPNDGTNLLRLSQITGTGPSPVWSVAPGSTYPGTGMFRVSNLFNFTRISGANCGVGGLTLLGARIGANAIFRNGRIWATHHAWLPATGTPDRTAAFWYQIDPAAMPNPIVQSGVIDGAPGSSHLCPSIAVNCADDVCIGMTRSDAIRCPGAAYAIRMAGDAAGTTRPVQVLRAGEGFYTQGPSVTLHWGRYSATVIDPVDDRSFWTVQEYSGPSYVVPFPMQLTLRKWALRWGYITQDCNLNGVVDTCDTSFADCNSNGISDPCECTHCDFNGDGKLNGADIQVFTTTLASPPPCDGPGFQDRCRADMNRDGALTHDDIPLFVSQLFGGSNCP